MDLPPQSPRDTGLSSGSSPGRNLAPGTAAGQQPPLKPPHDAELSPERARELEEKRRTFDAARLFTEKERIAARGRIRQFMFGSLDGLLVPLGVVSGVAGGTANSKIVVIAGAAEAFAGALSMGAGEYLSGKSETQVQ